MKELNEELERRVAERTSQLEAQLRRVEAEPQASIARQASALERHAAKDARAIEILESMSDGFVGLDRDWRYTYINRAAERMALLRAKPCGLMPKE